MKASVQVKHWPNTQAAARRLAEEFSTTPGLLQKLIDYAAGCVQPGFDYLENKLWTEFLPIVNAFKTARLFNPEKVTELKPPASTIDELKVFSFLEDAILNLKAELAEYMGLAEGVTKIDILEWWVKNEEKLPNSYKKIV